MGNWSAEFNGAGSGGDSLMGIAGASQTGLNPTGSFSVWFWVRKNEAYNSHTGRMITTKLDSGGVWQYRALFNALDGNALRIQVYETALGNIHDRQWAALALGDETEAHVVITFDGAAVSADAQFELFKNGVSQGGGTLADGGLISGTYASDGNFQIGGLNADAFNLEQTWLYDFRFYDAVVAPTTTTYKQLLATPASESNLQLNVFRGTSNERWTANSALVQDASTNSNNLGITHQSVADTPIETDIWPGPSSGDVEDPTETAVGGIVSDNGPGGAAVLFQGPIYRGQPAIGIAALPLVYSDKMYRGQAASEWTLGSGAPGAALVYRMRGYDTTLTATVFWASDHVDSTAVDYGGPGPVTNIVVQKKLGA